MICKRTFTEQNFCISCLIESFISDILEYLYKYVNKIKPPRLLQDGLLFKINNLFFV